MRKPQKDFIWDIFCLIMWSRPIYQRKMHLYCGVLKDELEEVMEYFFHQVSLRYRWVKQVKQQANKYHKYLKSCV